MNKDHWILVPNHQINGLDFESDYAIIKKELGKPQKICKEYESNSRFEVYPSFHVYYSANNKFEAIEFFGKAISLSINSQIIFPGTLNTAQRIFPDLEECHGSYISRTYSIGIYAENDIIVSILAGCKDYYNKNLS